ncbi:MAG: TOBE domain-containing protein [Pseudomonadales bacterium]|nr:TOBE domain-containing protein [Pseudomonadales bacterium]
MKISARNQFKGTVTAVHPGAVNSEVVLDIGGGDSIVATVTNGSLTAMRMAVGKEVIAMAKASSVLLMTDGQGYVLSARNILRGVVTEVTLGAVNGEVSVQLGGGAMAHAMVTHEAIASLGLEKGQPVMAVIKASSVMLAVPA